MTSLSLLESLIQLKYCFIADNIHQCNRCLVTSKFNKVEFDTLHTNCITVVSRETINSLSVVCSVPPYVMVEPQTLDWMTVRGPPPLHDVIWSPSDSDDHVGLNYLVCLTVKCLCSFIKVDLKRLTFETVITNIKYLL